MRRLEETMSAVEDWIIAVMRMWSSRCGCVVSREGRESSDGER